MVAYVAVFSVSFISGKRESREGSGTEVTKFSGRGGGTFLLFYSRLMRSRDFPLPLAFSS